MKNFNLKLNKEEIELKDNLKSMGQKLQKDSHEFGVKLKSVLESEYGKKENRHQIIKVGFKQALWGKRLLVGGMAGLVLICIVWTISSYTLQVGQDIGAPKERQIDLERKFLGNSAGTFKERFLDKLGQHQASPEEIAKRGAMLEQDLNISLISSKKDSKEFAQNIFDKLGGFVERVDQNKYQNAIIITGKIPAANLEALRIMLKDYAEKDKYYQEFMEAVNRTADMIKAEDETRLVEDGIEYLKGAIAREQDPKKQELLRQKLEENLAYLGERQSIEKKIEDMVDYADISITLIKIPSLIKAHSWQELKTVYAGFNNLDFSGRIVLNILMALVVLILIFSYTFWLVIPLGLWLILRHRRLPSKALYKELE
ncbi:MAG: hypothetical protein ABH896_02770 [Candidatus Jacksonbacteria bacterium]